MNDGFSQNWMLYKKYIFYAYVKTLFLFASSRRKTNKKMLLIELFITKLINVSPVINIDKNK